MTFPRARGLVLALGILLSAGCVGASDLPDGSTDVTQGGSVISLANSKWQFYQATDAGQSLPFVTVVFGPQAMLDHFEDNTLASDIFGDTILFDGGFHDTPLAGLQYTATTNGAETVDAFGFTFDARLLAFAGGLQVATATATVQAAYDGDDPDVVSGTFTFTAAGDIQSLLEGDLNVEFTIVGHRVAD